MLNSSICGLSGPASTFPSVKETPGGSPVVRRRNKPMLLYFISNVEAARVPCCTHILILCIAMGSPTSAALFLQVRRQKRGRCSKGGWILFKNQMNSESK